MVVHRTVDVGSLRLHVAEEGSGPPVVLLHGFPEFWYSWRAQMSALAAAGFRAIAPDLRGYGDSDKPPRTADYRASLVAGDIAGLIRSLDAGSAPHAVPVVGHDWGGPIAYRLAMDHPELVSRLFILNGPHPDHFRRLLRTSAAQRRRSWYIFFFQLPLLPERALRAPGVLRRMFRRSAARPELFTDEVMGEYERAFAKPGVVRAALSYYRAARTRDARPRGGVTCPTTVIWGMKDVALGPENLEGLDRWVPGVRIHRIEGASHWVQQDAADEVNAILLRELREPRSTQP
jgi:pimeloyl-ACP methyl ester carboxylesterase